MRRASIIVTLALLALAPRPSARPGRGFVQPEPGALAIIVHRSNPVDGLTLNELRQIFLLDTQSWPDKHKITVVLREKGQPERAEAIRLLCGMSETQFDRHLLFLTFNGTITRGPRAIQSANAMIRFVFNVPGAIGYIPAELADGSVKVLRVGGRLPGDSQYPLRRPQPKPPAPGI